MEWFHMVRGFTLAAIVVFASAFPVYGQCAEEIGDRHGVWGRLNSTVTITHDMPYIRLWGRSFIVDFMSIEVEYGFYQMSDGMVIAVRCS